MTDHPTIIIDTREQRPYSFSEGISILRTALPAGDYSIAGHETDFAVERKSVDDWVSTIIHARERFRAECQRLRDYDRAYIVVEASWPDLLAGLYKSKAHPDSVLAMSLAIMHQYQIPVILAGDRPTSREIVENLCVQYARRQESARRRANCDLMGIGLLPVDTHEMARGAACEGPDWDSFEKEMSE